MPQSQPTRCRMNKLRLENRVPPTLYLYIQPESGQKFSGWNIDSVMNQVHAHRLQNNYPIPLNFREQILDGICEQLIAQGFSEWCQDELYSDAMIDPNQEITAQDVMRATATIATYKLKGSPSVGQEEANRRAQICLTCSLNVNSGLSGCQGCAASRIRELIESTVGNNSTPYDSGLKSCAACKCLLSVIVHFPLEIIHKFESSDWRQRHLPNHCWKR